MKEDRNKLIPGLPASEEEAVSLIEEIETSSSSDWLPLESILEEVEKCHEIYAC